MFQKSVNITCPNCGGADTYEYRQNDRIGCGDCKLEFAEEDVEDWELGGDLPDLL